MKRNSAITAAVLEIANVQDHAQREVLLRNIRTRFPDKDDADAILLQFSALLKLTIFIQKILNASDDEAKNLCEEFLAISDPQLRRACVFELVNQCRNSELIRDKMVKNFPDNAEGDLVYALLLDDLSLMHKAMIGGANFFEFLDPDEVRFLNVKQVRTLLNNYFEMVEAVESEDLERFDTLKTNHVLVYARNNAGKTMFAVARNHQSGKKCEKMLAEMLILYNIALYTHQMGQGEEEDMRYTAEFLEKTAAIYPQEFINHALRHNHECEVLTDITKTLLPPLLKVAHRYRVEYVIASLGKLVNLGVDLNHLDEDGNNALMAFVESNNEAGVVLIFEVIDFLLMSGIDLNRRNNEGKNLMELMMLKYQRYYEDLTLTERARAYMTESEAQEKQECDDFISEAKKALRYVMSFYLNSQNADACDASGNTQLMSYVKAMRFIQVDEFGQLFPHMLEDALKKLNNSFSSQDFNAVNNVGNNALMEFIESPESCMQVFIPLARCLISKGLNLRQVNLSNQNLAQLMQQNEEKLWQNSALNDENLSAELKEKWEAILLLIESQFQEVETDTRPVSSSPKTNQELVKPFNSQNINSR